MPNPSDQFAVLLSDVADRLDDLWAQYRANGPGNVDSALFEPIKQRTDQLCALLLDQLLPGDVDRLAIQAALDRATDLARRCATQSQGLCFISGEAGLVPRRDQIEAFAATRATIRATVGRLGG